jgi:DNA mismatch repair protein MutS2
MRAKHKSSRLQSSVVGRRRDGRVIAHAGAEGSRREAPRDDLAAGREAWAGPVLDVLHAAPRMALDAAAIARVAGFVFAGGEAGADLRPLLRAPTPTPTAWDPATFEAHLHLRAWVEHLAALPLGGRPLLADVDVLHVYLSRPPRDAETRALRAEVLAELDASPALADATLALRAALRALRACFQADAASSAGHGLGHRLEIVRALRAVLDLAADGLEPARSALGAVHRFAAEWRGTEAFARLVDLIEHDRRAATVDLSLRIGADGRVRALEIRRIREDVESRFHQPPLARWLARLALVWRGYRFSEAELVERWVDQVFGEHLALVPALLQLTDQLDVYLTALALRDHARARGLGVALPRFVDGDGEGRLEGLWNPLLLARGAAPVPCTIVRPAPGQTTIVTGPNSGGKTRLMQAIGLAQLFAEGGLFVPASAATLRPTPFLFCSLVEEEGADQPEGRLGTELLRVRQLFEQAPPGALVMIDELCSGTNPSEGEEIFELVLELLRELGPETWVTTHFLDFAHRLAARAADAHAAGAPEVGLRFLRVELGADEAPTYRFVEGVATTSLAGRAAARLGVTREELRRLVRRHAPPAP